MTEAFSDPNDNLNAEFDALIDSSFGERGPENSPLEALLTKLHIIHDVATDGQARNDDEAESLAEMIHPPRRQRIYVNQVDPAIMPSGYEEALFIPNGPASTLALNSVYIRHPVVRVRDFGMNSDYEYVPQDTCVQLLFKNGDNHMYWINDKGATLFGNGGDIDYDDSEMWDVTKQDKRPNVFSVMGVHNYTTPLSVEAIDAFVFDCRPEPRY